MLVRDVMETDLVTVDVSATLRDVAETLLREHVGSVIVTDDGNPTGIVTETDLVSAGYVTDVPFSEIPVDRVMGEPLVWVDPAATVRAAVTKMGEEDIKKLPVVEDLDLVGIVTVSDVTGRYGDIVREVRELDSQRDSWESEKLREAEMPDRDDHQ